MSYYNEFFVENNNNKLTHVGSCTGSDTPGYFDEVKNLKDWDTQLAKLKQENGFYPHSNKHPFPWKTYKTSDNLLVLRSNERKWFEFWKQTHQVWVSINKFRLNNDNKSYFIKANQWIGDGNYSKMDIIILEFPPIE